jgi:hypothetical protein
MNFFGLSMENSTRLQSNKAIIGENTSSNRYSCGKIESFGRIY